jgi:hypothetical protein
MIRHARSDKGGVGGCDDPVVLDEAAREIGNEVGSVTEEDIRQGIEVEAGDLLARQHEKRAVLEPDRAIVDDLATEQHDVPVGENLPVARNDSIEACVEQAVRKEIDPVDFACDQREVADVQDGLTADVDAIGIREGNGTAGAFDPTVQLAGVSCADVIEDRGLVGRIREGEGESVVLGLLEILPTDRRLIAVDRELGLESVAAVLEADVIAEGRVVRVFPLLCTGVSGWKRRHRKEAEEKQASDHALASPEGRRLVPAASTGC